MNHITFGKLRDEKIIKLIEQGGAFTRKQVEKIIIPEKKSGVRITQKRLQQLARYGRIKQLPNGPHEGYIYCVKRPKHFRHALLINDVYCALLEQKPKLYRLDFKWSYSILGGEAIADAMATIYTDPDKKNRQVVWIEVERTPSKRFNKVEQYTKIFNKNWLSEPWVVVKDDKAYFPTVLIVTDENLTITTDKPRFIILDSAQVYTDIYRPLIRGELLR